MAIVYNTVYQGYFCDKSGETINIEFKGRADSALMPPEPIQLIFAGHDEQPIIISYKEEGDRKDNPINGSECTINIKAINNFELSSLYTLDERYWLIVISGAWNWTGWLIPDSCSEPYEAKPYDVTIRATDALGTLKDTPFLDANNSRYKGFYTDIAVLKEVFLKTGLPLDIGVAINTFESTMNGAICPLSQTYINTARFLDADNNPFSCEEVLRSILQRWSARLHQFNGKWQIVNMPELSRGTAVKMWNFDYLGATKTATTIGNNATVGGRDRVLMPVSATNSITKAYKSSTAYYQYGYPTNQLLNGDFNDFSFPMVLPNHWAIHGTVTASVGTSVESASDKYLRITSSEPTDSYVYNDTKVQVRATESVEVRFDMINLGGDGTPTDTVYLSVLIEADNGGWFTNTGWKPYFDYYVIVKKGRDFYGKTSINFNVEAQTSDYGLTIGLKALGRVGGVQWVTDFNNVQVKPSVNSEQTKPPLGIFNKQTLTSAQTYVPDAILLLHSDDANTQRTSQILINNGVTGVNWSRSGITESTSLLHIIANSELRAHQRPYRIFEGDFKGLGYVDINTFITIDLLEGNYIFLSGDFDLKTGFHRIRIAEVITDEAVYVEELAQDYGSMKNSKGNAIGLPEGVGVTNGTANLPILAGYALLTDIPTPIDISGKADLVGAEDIEITNPYRGVVIHSGNGKRWRIGVTDLGAIIATEIV